MGRLQSGTRLPGARDLAAELRVARITVSTAYDQLVAEGYLETRPRLGTYVAAGIPAAGFDEARPIGASPPRLPPVNRWIPAEPVTVDDSSDQWTIDLGPERFSLEFVRDRRWQLLLAAAWRQLRHESNPHAASYFGAFGDPALRRELATYLTVRRAVRCSADGVVVTAGSMAAFAAVARVWLGPGRRCVVEDPSGEQLRRALASAGGEIVPVPTDEDGLRVDLLPPRADVVFVTPSWQYPGGGSMPIARRLRLLSWARAANALVVEDDCESELRYEGGTLPSLQGLSEDGQVLYVSTFSKVLFPGLRTGYAVVHDTVRGPFLAALEAGGRGPGVLEQRALALLLADGGFDQHVRRLRAAYRGRRDAFIGELTRGAGEAMRIRPATGGGHLVAVLRDPRWTASSFVAALMERGVRIEPLSANRIRPADDREIVVYYPRHDSATLRSVAGTMAAVLRGGPVRNEQRPGAPGFRSPGSRCRSRGRSRGRYPGY
jgi:GntR family transcriptional regulator/MocR family aminotransferase